MKKLCLCVVAVMIVAANANAQINLNRLQKAAQSAIKQNMQSQSKQKQNSPAQQQQYQEPQESANDAEEQIKSDTDDDIKMIEAEEEKIDALSFNQKNDPAFSRTSKEATLEFIRKSPIQYPKTKAYTQGWDYYKYDGSFGLFEYWDNYLMPKNFPKKPENIALRDLQMHYRPYDETTLMQNIEKRFGLYTISTANPHCVYYEMNGYASIELMDHLLNELKNNGFTPTRKPTGYKLEEMNKGYDYEWNLFSNDYYAYMTCRKSHITDEYMYMLAFVPHNMESVDVFDGVPMPVEGYPSGVLTASVFRGSGDNWEYDSDANFNGKNKQSGMHWEMRDYEFPCFSLNGLNKYCARLEKAGFAKEQSYSDGNKLMKSYRKGEYFVYLTLDRDKHILILSATDSNMISDGW